jgi:hypothetical protein
MLAQLYLNACATGTRMPAPLESLRLDHGEAAVDAPPWRRRTMQ